jgi:hypothetical protein
MTRTQATEPASRHDAWRNSVIKTLGDFSELAARPWDQLREIEIFPGCRLGSDEFVVPADYLLRVPGDCDHRFRLIATRRSD